MEIPFDVETIPEQPEDEAIKLIAETITPPAQMKKAETIQDWQNGTGKYAGAKEAEIDETYLKTSFDGARGQICSISWAIDMVSDPLSMFAIPGTCSEADLLSNFFASLRNALNKKPPFFVGHNIGNFDLPYLYQRAVVNGVNPGMKLGQHGRHGQHFFDNMNEWAGWKNYISQDALCKALGIVIDDPPGMEGMDGSQVWGYYKDGRYADIEAYNRVDVLKVQANYRRLTFS